MSKSKKILNYIVMACAIISTIVFCIDQNWYAALWAFLALLWMVNSHLAEECYNSQKEELDELTDDYYNSVIEHEKEVKVLKDEIKKLNKKGE